MDSLLRHWGNLLRVFSHNTSMHLRKLDLNLVVVIYLEKLLLVCFQHVLQADAVVVANEFKPIPKSVNLLHNKTCRVYLLLSWQQMPK
jgi:hypothetical protein